MNLKLLPLLLLTVITAMTACRHEAAAPQPQPTLMEVSKQELATAVEERDRLLRLVTQLAEDIEQIRRMEDILTHDNAENSNPAETQKIIADMTAIKKALSGRRRQLAELETRLQSSALFSQELQDAINSLRRQIDSRNREINRLREQLGTATLHIENLQSTVDSLSTAVDEVTDSKNRAEQTASDLKNELNRCYYAIGSRRELNTHHILESGFLRKTRLLEGEFDSTFFYVADRRHLDSLHLHSRKGRVLTRHPDGSYRLETAADGSRTLVILDPDAFWKLSNYLVIQTD
ncbi:MAG: hypothetical protein K2I56_07970 [Muribaculaceae bacterium]|nr:hypothetical protein [Muribaculaceae bacterium]